MEHSHTHHHTHTLEGEFMETIQELTTAVNTLADLVGQLVAKLGAGAGPTISAEDQAALDAAGPVAANAITAAQNALGAAAPGPVAVPGGPAQPGPVG